MVDANLTIGHTHQLIDAIGTIIAANALGALKANTVLARLVTRDWENEFAVKGQSVQIFKRGALTVNDKTEHAAVTLQQPASDKATITLDKHKEVSFLIEDFGRAIARPDVLAGYTEDAMKVVGEQIDADIAALYTGATGSIDASGASGPLDASDFVEARRLLNASKYPLGDRYAVLHEDAESDFLKIEEVINSAYSGSLGGAVASSYAGRFAGFDTHLDQKIAVATAVCKNLFFHKSAFALATRPLPPAPAGSGVIQSILDEDGVGLRVTLSYNADLLGVQVTVDVLYGVATILGSGAVCVSTTEK